VNSDTQLNRPVLTRHARYRWDDVRCEHHVVFPEGVLVLNDTGAAIVKLCDGRSTVDLIAAVEEQFPGEDPVADVRAFLARLAKKGLLCDADS
jgi:coenzyme PQQ biosynthesis protein PqqD